MRLFESEVEWDPASIEGEGIFNNQNVSEKNLLGKMSRPLPLKLLISLSLIIAIYITFSHVLKHEFVRLDEQRDQTVHVFKVSPICQIA